jgi:hypothetical protein
MPEAQEGELPKGSNSNNLDLHQATWGPKLTQVMYLVFY